MAKQLFKLVLSGTTQAVPTETRYFYKKSVAITVNSLAYDIPKSLLWTDSGALLGSSPITLRSTNNGYYLLFIDGVLQQSALYTVNSLHIELSSVTAPYTLVASAPITLALTNFAPTTVVHG